MIDTATIQTVREKGILYFNQLAKRTNLDEGLLMITFSTKLVSTRRVDDIGREEDVDYYIGLDKDGWISYTQTNRNGGNWRFQIMKSSVDRMTDKTVYEALVLAADTSEEYADFMKKVNEIMLL